MKLFRALFGNLISHSWNPKTITPYRWVLSTYSSTTPTHSFACDTGLFPGLCCTDFIFCLVLIAIFVPFPVVHFPKESNIVVWVPKLFQWTWILFKPVTFWGEIRTITRQIHSCIFCTLFAITVTLSFFFPPFIFDICEFVLKV